MAILPRPVSPRRAWADLRDYLREGRKHRLLLLLLAVAMTWIIVWGFLLDAKTNTGAPRRIMYITSWTADRSDVEILEQQKKDVAAREAAIEKKQSEFRKVADTMGIEWRQDAARNDARRKEAIREIGKQLDARLAAARAKQAAESGQ